MSLQLVIGSAGSGKSTYLRACAAREARLHPERNYIYMVPEQFTMRTQYDLVMEQENKGILNIDVLSFQRLAWRVLEEAGQENAAVLTETGKSLLLRKIAIEKKDELGILGRKLDRAGYVAEVKSALSEFAQYRIGPEDLEEMIAFSEKRPALQYKLKDLKILQDAFNEELSDRLLTGEELQEKLAYYASDSELLGNSTLVLDGFTGFTPIQMNVLRALLRTCRDVLVAVTADPEEDLFGPVMEHELFALSKKTIAALTKTAVQEKVEILDPVFLPNEGKRFDGCPALAHLEKNLFRPGAVPFEEETDAVTLRKAATPAEEAKRAAIMIRHLKDKEDIRYDEIAVIVGDMPSYVNEIRRYFSLYRIPVFLDRKLDLLFNPCLEFVRGAMEMVRKHFDYESTFRFLRTGFAGIDEERLDLAENYCLASGISSSAAWKREWTYIPSSMKEETVAVCEETRVYIMERLGEFLELFSPARAKVSDYALGVRKLLESFEVERQLEEEADILAGEGYPERAQEYRQIYGTVTALLDEITQLIGETQQKQADFIQILDAGFEEAKIGVIPPGRDRVQVGDLERTRLEHVKVLLFLGMNDGWIPASDSQGGILSEIDRIYLADSGIELAPGERENSCIQRFYLYLTLTKPSGQLHVFQSTGTVDGKSLRPSYMIEELHSLFPKAACVKEPDPGTDPEEIVSARTAAAYLAGLLGREEKSDEQLAEAKQLAASLREFGYAALTDRLLDAAFMKTGQETIPADLAGELFGSVLEGSVTRFETYAECAGRHFLDYGLKLKEREVREVTGADMGTVFHKALQLYSARLETEHLGWRDADRAKQEELVRECVEEAVDQCRHGIFRESARNEQLSGRIERILKRTVWALTEQIRAGDFEPAVFEKNFRRVLEDERGATVLKGRIDRVDILEKDEKRYVKVIDYKSGAAGLDLNELLSGLGMQLCVYMDAAMQMEMRDHPESEIRPGAMFYNHLSDPVINASPDEDARTVENGILKELRPDGLFIDSDAVVGALDRMMDGTSLVIPAKLNTDGSMSAASGNISEGMMDRLLDVVRKQILDFSGEIREGQVTRNPVKNRKTTACAYCSWNGLCGFDPKIPGSMFRRIPVYSKDRIFEEIILRTEDETDGQLD